MQFRWLKHEEDIEEYTCSSTGREPSGPLSTSGNTYARSADLRSGAALQILHSGCTCTDCLFSDRTGQQVVLGWFSPIIPVQVTTNKMLIQQVIMYLHIFDVFPCMGVGFVRVSWFRSFFFFFFKLT